VVGQGLVVEVDLLGRLVLIAQLAPAKDGEGVADGEGEEPGGATGVSSWVEAVDSAAALGRGDESEELPCLSEFFASRADMSTSSQAANSRSRRTSGELRTSSLVANSFSW
jgi:hypothetical protein